MVSFNDIQALIELRAHLTRLTEIARKGHGWTYDEEIDLLDRVIAELDTL